MEMMKGECKFCGQMQNVEAENQEDADAKATELCGCDLANKQKQHDEVIKKINDMCFAPKADTGFQPVAEDTYKLICILADKVIDQDIEAVKLELSDRTVKINVNAKGVVKFRQRRIIEIGIDG